MPQFENHHCGFSNYNRILFFIFPKLGDRKVRRGEWVKEVEREKKGRTNRNHYQPRILCPSNHIEARLA